MHSIKQLLTLLALFTGLSFAPAHAETFHTCGSIITSLPTQISTQGVYCLSHDISTAITSGNAILINTNNVTIDCNGYKIGGLGAGTSSTTNGISADATRQNITVRNCGIRGFYYGIDLAGGAGHLIEDNRLDNNLYIGIYVIGNNNRVQRNRVYDTGGYPGNSNSYGIIANADVIDNTVAGVFSTTADSNSNGIQVNEPGAEIRGNQVRELLVTGLGSITGIYASAGGITFRGNSVSESAFTAGNGIYGNGATDSFCLSNTVHKVNTAIANCQLGSDNLTN
jgi:hypothetical protein